MELSQFLPTLDLSEVFYVFDAFALGWRGGIMLCAVRVEPA